MNTLTHNDPYRNYPIENEIDNLNKGLLLKVSNLPLFTICDIIQQLGEHYQCQAAVKINNRLFHLGLAKNFTYEVAGVLIDSMYLENNTLVLNPLTQE